MDELPPNKRQRTPSYTQSVKDGGNPRAYSAAYEVLLTQAGVYMHAHQHPTIAASDDSQLLCTSLLYGEHDTPDYFLFHGHLFAKALGRVYGRNEARVVRDITPALVPSVEHLWMKGHEHLEHLTEEIKAEWTKCTSLAGPRPASDFCVGLMSSAFTEEEMVKLKAYTAPDRCTQVTDFLYFPFLMCEAKSGEQALSRAERQNMHSSSIAVNALIQLHRASSRAEELDGQVLAFSISHDSCMVKIHGHYAQVKDEKTFFYRHLIHSFDFTALQGKERWTTYNFTRAVYDKFAPLHLKRIQDGLAHLRDVPPAPIVPDSGVDANTEASDSQEVVIEAPSSQEGSAFKLPALPERIQQQEEIKRQKEEIERQKAQLDLLLNQQQDFLRLLGKQQTQQGSG